MRANLEEACAAYVASKDRLDSDERELSGGTWHFRMMRWLQGWTRPKRCWTSIHPSKFVAATLPFSYTSSDASTMKPVSIPSFFILSGRYQDYSESVFFTPRPVIEVMDWSDNLVREAPRYHQTPRSCQIGDLPLFIALEGKNRVELFKAAQREMTSLVTPSPFPPANALELHKSWPFRIYSVSDGTRRAVLPIPEIVLPVLQAYGVDMRPTPNFSIRDFFKIRSIRQDLYQQQMRP